MSVLDSVSPEETVKQAANRSVATFVVSFDPGQRGVLIKFALKNGGTEICHFEVSHLAEVAQVLGDACERLRWPLFSGSPAVIAEGEAQQDKVLFVRDNRAIMLEDSIILLLQTDKIDVVLYKFPADLAHSLFGGLHDALRKGRMRNVANEAPPTSARN